MLERLKREISCNLTDIKKSFALYGRDIKLVAVTKRQTLEKLRILQELGHRDFGENYLQELERKASLFPNATWHYLGKIQSNKIKKIVGLSNVIHSLSSIKHIEKVDEVALSFNKEICAYLQINFTEEEQKNGLYINDLVEVLDCVKKKKNLKILGFMVMTGKDQSQEEKAQVFEGIYYLMKKYQNDYPFLQSLSMGMSSDYLLALKHGSDCVRLGEKLLGKRVANNKA